MLLVQEEFIGSAHYSLGPKQGLRPVVCLKDGVTLETLEQGKAKLVAPMVQVEAKQAEVTVNYGDNVTFDSLFTVTTRDGGTSEIYYAVDGINGPLVNCSELSLGTHDVICVATYNGVTETASVTVVVESAKMICPECGGTGISVINECASCGGIGVEGCEAERCFSYNFYNHCTRCGDDGFINDGHDNCESFTCEVIVPFGKGDRHTQELP